MIEVIIAAVVAIVIGFLIGYFLMQNVLKKRNEATQLEAKQNERLIIFAVKLW